MATEPKEKKAMATELSMKLLIDKKAGKVLFAEAGKEVIDFILSFLLLPVGSVIRLLSHDTMPGSIGELYHSVQTISETYIKENDKGLLLQPKMVSLPQGWNQTLLLENGSSSDSQVFKCSYSGNCSYYTDVSGTACGNCRNPMSKKMTYIGPSSNVVTASNGEGGFVKGVVTYMIMDDLAVSPMSTISSITLLNKCNVKDLGALEEKVVKMGKKAGLELLRVSLVSKAVLTDVFLGSKVEKC